MNTEQQAIEFPSEIQVGDEVWWQSGLSYLVATYRKGTPVAKFRPEPIFQVKVLEMTIDERWPDSTHFVIETPCHDFPIHTVDRWISTDKNIPCEALLQAHGIYL